MKRIEVHGWTLDVGKKKVKIYDDNDEITDGEAVSIVQYLFEEGLVSTMKLEVEIISK